LRRRCFCAAVLERALGGRPETDNSLLALAWLPDDDGGGEGGEDEEEGDDEVGRVRSWA
jgi:hypothetical protein